MKRPTPLDAPRHFRIDEMFFSTTDRRGVIQSGNDVFVRVSGYDREQLVGHPHNVIRHPAMPRAVFRLVWGFLLRGDPVAGLVKNLASDGRHYWVVAFFMPIGGGRFLSIRFKPSSELLPVVESLYAKMCAVEAEPVEGGAAAAMQAAGACLDAALRERGFSSYDGFMRALLHEELKSRDATLARQGLRLFPVELGARAGDERGGSVARIHASGVRAYREINAFYVRLDEFARINERLAVKSAFVLGLTKEFRFIAFNAALRSARLGGEGRGLVVIADYLNTVSAELTGVVKLLAGAIDEVSGRLRTVVFNLAAARLQLEMVLSFCAELLAAENDATAGLRQRMIQDLQQAFAETIGRAVKALTELARDVTRLSASSGDMRRIVLTLQVAQVGGLVEASQLKEDDSFTLMFADLREGVERTKAALEELDEAGSRLAALADETPVIEAVIAKAVEEMAGESERVGESESGSGGGRGAGVKDERAGELVKVGA